MKRTAMMLLGALTSMGPLTVFSQVLAMHLSGDVRWVCGGVGANERSELGGLRPQANLELNFVTVKRGGYIADVAVSITSEKAKAPLFETTSDGPVCLLHVSPGRYRIEATYGGAKRSATTTVATDSKRPVRIVLAFPAESWDGIWASDEEKRQAREP